MVIGLGGMVIWSSDAIQRSKMSCQIVMHIGCAVLDMTKTLRTASMSIIRHNQFREAMEMLQVYADNLQEFSFIVDQHIAIINGWSEQQDFIPVMESVAFRVEAGVYIGCKFIK